MDWIENEYSSMNIGDKRLNKRAKQLLKRLSIKNHGQLKLELFSKKTMNV